MFVVWTYRTAAGAVGKVRNPAALAGFPSVVGKSALWTFPRSRFFHSSLTHKFCYRARILVWTVVWGHIFHSGCFAAEAIYRYSFVFRWFLVDLRESFCWFKIGSRQLVHASIDGVRRLSLCPTRSNIRGIKIKTLGIGDQDI